MSSVDILEDSFTHGTPAGFDQGCKSGGLCPNKGAPDVMTCKEAKHRYASDRDYRTVIDAGRPWVALASVPKSMLSEVAGSPTPSNFETFKKRRPATDISDALRAKLAESDFPHGTTAGYQRGCKGPQEHLCTGDDDGRTCAQAMREYRNDWRATKRTQEVKATLQKAGVPAASLDKAAAGAIVLSEAATITALDATDIATTAIADFDLSEYAAADAPDVAVDALVETLDDTRHRLTDAQAAVASLEVENDRLLKLTSTQTDTILGLREKVAEAEQVIDRQRAELEQLRAELAATAASAVVAEIIPQPVMYAPESDDRVNLSLDPKQAANVILALAGGAR